MKVLVVDDDESQAGAIASVLRSHGWDVCWTPRGNEVLYAHRDADVVLVGLGEADSDGLALIARLRGLRLGAIVVMSDKDDASSIVSGLRCGAHGFLAKPVRAAELLACVDAVSHRVRRRDRSEEKSADGWCLDGARRVVVFGGREIHLTDIEFRIVSLLAARPGAVVAREVILEYIWGRRYESSSRALDVHLSAIRAKLPSRDLVVNVRGVGFYLARKAVCTHPVDDEHLGRCT